jgi:hypothetical protein
VIISNFDNTAEENSPEEVSAKIQDLTLSRDKNAKTPNKTPFRSFHPFPTRQAESQKESRELHPSRPMQLQKPQETSNQSFPFIKHIAHHIFPSLPFCTIQSGKRELTRPIKHL